MADLLLAKPKLPPGFIDLSIGEANFIKENLFKIFGKYFQIDLSLNKKSEYPHPNGYEPLVQILEDKYQAPVVITNGAKQALGATFYSLKKLGKERPGMRVPYWALIPPLAEAHGIQCTNKNNDSYLAVLPNNPDGFMLDYDYLKYLSDLHKDRKVPFIHDAAYFTPIYINGNYNFGPVGDVQIFSASKMYGMSGLRIGYAVCYNTEYYKLIQEYMETFTVGVSNISQDIFYQMLVEFEKNNDKYNLFIKQCQNSLYAAKALVKTINPNILEIPDNLLNTPGMFLWAKVKRNIFNEAKLNVSDGKHFGSDGFIRINLGLETNDLVEVVRRINNCS